MIRTLLFDRDADTDAKSVLDIREFDEPAGTTPRTWTDLANEKNLVRREMILSLMRQIDQVMSGEVDEIVICRT